MILLKALRDFVQEQNTAFIKTALGLYLLDIKFNYVVNK